MSLSFLTGVVCGCYCRWQLQGKVSIIQGGKSYMCTPLGLGLGKGLGLRLELVLELGLR